MHDDDDEEMFWPDPQPTLDRPTMLNSCSRAATTAEARFRVQYPNSLTRASRIFALDAGAAEAMYAVTEEPWNGARFLTVCDGGVSSGATDIDDLPLSAPHGTKAILSEELEGADVVVLLASSVADSGAAEIIAREAHRRRIMVVGLALGGDGGEAGLDKTVAALRPFASVLVVASDHEFIPAMLSALRA
jgi:hypothetical protein